MIGSVTTLGLGGLPIANGYGWSGGDTIVVTINYPPLLTVQSGNQTIVIRTGYILQTDPFNNDLPDVSSKILIVNSSNVTIEAFSGNYKNQETIGFENTFQGLGNVVFSSNTTTSINASLTQNNQGF